MRERFWEGDTFILDRAYRDITPLLDNIGILEEEAVEV